MQNSTSARSERVVHFIALLIQVGLSTAILGFAGAAGIALASNQDLFTSLEQTALKVSIAALISGLTLAVVGTVGPDSDLCPGRFIGVLSKHIARDTIAVVLIGVIVKLTANPMIGFGTLVTVWLFETIAMALWVRDARKKGICTIGSH
ncbi:hypothetical protein MCEMSE15_00649 [Fimbriimonadaceae bacterium]